MTITQNICRYSLTLILSLLCINAFADTAEELGDNPEVSESIMTRAKEGNTWDMVFVGDMYRFSKTCKRPQMAFKWYLKAMRAEGISYHVEIVAECYDAGLGVIKDDVEAYAYYNISGMELESSRIKRDELSKKMTPSQIEAAQKRSKELLVGIAAAEKQREKKFREALIEGFEKYHNERDKKWWQFWR
jgi:uncharacterized protein YbcV (DUF1398 family)